MKNACIIKRMSFNDTWAIDEESLNRLWTSSLPDTLSIFPKMAEDGWGLKEAGEECHKDEQQETKKVWWMQI